MISFCAAGLLAAETFDITKVDPNNITPEQQVEINKLIALSKAEQKEDANNEVLMRAGAVTAAGVAGVFLRRWIKARFF